MLLSINSTDAISRVEYLDLRKGVFDKKNLCVVAKSESHGYAASGQNECTFSSWIDCDSSLKKHTQITKKNV